MKFYRIIKVYQIIVKVCQTVKFYQIPRMCCIIRLTKAMPIQQQNPVRIGFIPVLTSLTIFVFRPIADIAMMIRNLLSSFNGAVTPAGR